MNHNAIRLVKIVLLFLLGLASSTQSYTTSLSLWINKCCSDTPKLRFFVFKMGYDFETSTTVTAGTVDGYVRAIDANEQLNVTALPGHVVTLSFPNDAADHVEFRSFVEIAVGSSAVQTLALIIAPPLGAVNAHATGIDPFTSSEMDQENAQISGTLTRATVRAAHFFPKPSETPGGDATASARFFVFPTKPYARAAREYKGTASTADAWDSVDCGKCYGAKSTMLVGKSAPQTMCTLTDPVGNQLPITTVVTDGFTDAFEKANGANMNALVVHLVGGTADQAISTHRSIRDALSGSDRNDASRTFDAVIESSYGAPYDAVYVISHDMFGENGDYPPEAKTIAECGPSLVCEVTSDPTADPPLAIPRLVSHARNAFMPCARYPIMMDDPGRLSAYANIAGMVASEDRPGCGGILAKVKSRMFVGAGSGANLAIAAALWGFGSTAVAMEPDGDLVWGNTRIPPGGFGGHDCATSAATTECCARRPVSAACCARLVSSGGRFNKRDCCGPPRAAVLGTCAAYADANGGTGSAAAPPPPDDTGYAPACCPNGGSVAYQGFGTPSFPRPAACCGSRSAGEYAKFVSDCCDLSLNDGSRCPPDGGGTPPPTNSAGENRSACMARASAARAACRAFYKGSCNCDRPDLDPCVPEVGSAPGGCCSGDYVESCCALEAERPVEKAAACCAKVTPCCGAQGMAGASDSCDPTTCCPYKAIDWESMCASVTVGAALARKRELPLRRIAIGTTIGGDPVPDSVSKFFASKCPALAGSAEFSSYYMGTSIDLPYAALGNTSLPYARDFDYAFGEIIQAVMEATNGHV